MITRDLMLNKLCPREQNTCLKLEKDYTRNLKKSK